MAFGLAALPRGRQALGGVELLVGRLGGCELDPCKAELRQALLEWPGRITEPFPETLDHASQGIDSHLGLCEARWLEGEVDRSELEEPVAVVRDDDGWIGARKLGLESFELVGGVGAGVIGHGC